MSGASKQAKAKEEDKIGGPQGFAEMCRRMMSGEVPDCCGGQMREMMSRWMGKPQAIEKKQDTAQCGGVNDHEDERGIL